jgi:parallel beta helix pectate lyase-like protein
MKRIVVAVALALAAMLPVMPANAQGAIRTFVSVGGSDSNPCSITAPCRHFSAALLVTAVGGEIDALEPGSYGSFTIMQAVTIEGQGWSYVAPPNGGNAITINAVSGNVTIHGVSANGVGATGTTNGIEFNSGSSLVISDCTLQNFTGSGIAILPASNSLSFAITNTTASNNGFAGIRYVPSGSTATANGVIDHVVASNNGNAPGISINTLGGGSATVAISNSIASGNSTNGIFIYNGSAALSVSIDHVSATDNGYGVLAEGTATVLLGRSVITSNITGVANSTSPNTFYSYGNNAINNNGTGPADDIVGTMNTTYTLR